MSPLPFSFNRSPPAALAIATVLLCSACQSVPQKVTVDFVEPKVAMPNPAASIPRPTNGSLFNAYNYRPAFEDPRARTVGDIVKIVINEGVTAEQGSNTNVKRTSGINNKVTAMPFETAPGLSALNIGASTENGLEDSGGITKAKTDFKGTISTTVIDVLPNGNLVVLGEKQIGLNQNVEVLRISGTIDPRFMRHGNEIDSTQVANVRIESKGRGAQAEAQTFGWLSRFFLSFSPF